MLEIYDNLESKKTYKKKERKKRKAVSFKKTR